SRVLFRSEPVEAPTTTPVPAAPKQPVTRLVRKVLPTPAVRAEAPALGEEAPPPAPIAAPPVTAAVTTPVVEPTITAPEVVAPSNGAEVKVTPAPLAPVAPPSR